MIDDKVLLLTVYGGGGYEGTDYGAQIEKTRLVVVRSRKWQRRHHPFSGSPTTDGYTGMGGK